MLHPLYTRAQVIGFIKHPFGSHLALTRRNHSTSHIIGPAAIYERDARACTAIYLSIMDVCAAAIRDGRIFSGTACATRVYNAQTDITHTFFGDSSVDNRIGNRSRASGHRANSSISALFECARLQVLRALARDYCMLTPFGRGRSRGAYIVCVVNNTHTHTHKQRIC